MKTRTLVIVALVAAAGLYWYGFHNKTRIPILDKLKEAV